MNVLAAAIRAELAALEPARACCRAAERAGLGAQAEGRARSAAVARLVVRLEQDGTGARPFDWADAAGHCQTSYLRGVFLANGSLSVGPSGSHLEFAVPVEMGESLAALLAALGLPARRRERRGRSVLTWKNSATIIDFLRRAGASGATLELEAQLVTRALRAHLNRVVNAESANLRRSVASARRQLAVIEALAAAGGLAALPRLLRNVARARQRSPEASFSQLARELNLSRSQVQRALEQLEQLALHLELAS